MKDGLEVMDRDLHVIETGEVYERWFRGPDRETMRLSAPPSEYFLRQCFIATEPDEALLSVVIDTLGDDNIVMSVDYPHADGPFPDGVAEFLDLPRVSRDSKRKILWDNRRRLYGFELVG